MPLLASIPLDIAIRKGGDEAQPVALDAESKSGQIFRNLATQLILDSQSYKHRVAIVRRGWFSEEEVESTALPGAHVVDDLLGDELRA